MENELPIVGVDIPFSDVGENGGLIRHFTPFASLENGKVTGSPAPLPYGSLMIELIKTPGNEAELPIAHRKDFELAWTMFMERSLDPNELDIWVFYKQKYSIWFMRCLNPFLPRLHFAATEHGYLGSSKRGTEPVDYANAYFEKFDHDQ